MDTAMREQLMSYVRKFIDPTQEEADYFISLFKPRKYLRRQFVVQAGEKCLVESFVISGCLRSYFPDNEGKLHILQFAIENWWISDMESLIRGVTSKLNIDALEETVVLQISKTDFDQLMVRYPKFEKMFRLMLCNAFISHQSRIIDNLCIPASERYANFVKQHPHIVQRVPQNQIASYLGMTPEFLSQIRKKFAGNKS